MQIVSLKKRLFCCWADVWDDPCPPARTCVGFDVFLSLVVALGLPISSHGAGVLKPTCFWSVLDPMGKHVPLASRYAKDLVTGKSVVYLHTHIYTHTYIYIYTHNIHTM